jgi:hypothetical protein
VFSSLLPVRNGLNGLYFASYPVTAMSQDTVFRPFFITPAEAGITIGDLIGSTLTEIRGRGTELILQKGSRKFAIRAFEDTLIVKEVFE